MPLDLVDAAGSWAYADDGLAISGVNLTMRDRDPAVRFEPLIARGASLTLADSVVTANAAVRHPYSGTVLGNVAITHDLGSGAGGAVFDVPGITFGAGLTPSPPASYCDPSVPGTGVP